MPHNFHRPNLPYDAESLPNDNRYQLLTRTNNRPPTDAMLDTDFNYVIDGMRQLDQDIVNVEAGALQGSDNPENANSLVTTDGAGNIGWVKIQDSNIANQSISNLKLIPQTITANEIQDGAVTTEKIAIDAVTYLQLADGAVFPDTLTTSAVTTIKIANNAVTAPKIANNTITATQIAPLTITAAQIANNTITATKIAPLTITAAQIANNTITATKIAPLTITAAQIAAQTITATQIADNTITFNQISNSFAATKSQQQSASSSSVFVSPARQQDHPSAAKAYVIFAGGDGTIQGQYGISTVTRISTGIYRITFSTPFASNIYITSITTESNPIRIGQVDTNFTATTTQIQIRIMDNNHGLSDTAFVNCIFYGAQ